MAMLIASRTRLSATIGRVGLEAEIEQLEVGLGLGDRQHRRGLGLGDELLRELVRGVELSGHHGGDAAGILRHDLDHSFSNFTGPLFLYIEGPHL